MLDACLSHWIRAVSAATLHHVEFIHVNPKIAKYLINTKSVLGPKSETVVVVDQD